jgi:hypothetical protein
MGCKARIKSLHTGETHYGECVDLSVDGLAFVVRLFPSMASACLSSCWPRCGVLPGKPLEAEVEVRRCNEVKAWPGL